MKENQFGNGVEAEFHVENCNDFRNSKNPLAVLSLMGTANLTGGFNMEGGHQEVRR